MCRTYMPYRHASINSYLDDHLGRSHSIIRGIISARTMKCCMNLFHHRLICNCNHLIFVIFLDYTLFPQYDVYGSPKRHTISTLDILQIMRVVSHIPASRLALHRWVGKEKLLHGQPTGDRML